MHKKLLVLMLLLVGSLAMANGPILKFDKKEVDLGNVDPGKKIEATFRFTNAGDQKLVIKSIKPG